MYSGTAERSQVLKINFGLKPRQGCLKFICAPILETDVIFIQNFNSLWLKSLHLTNNNKKNEISLEIKSIIFEPPHKYKI